MTRDAYDLIAIGRIGVDFYPQQTGSFTDATTFSKSVGGSAANVAVACARLGRNVALITKVGEDRPGVYLRAALNGFGVDTRHVGTCADLKTPIVIAELDPAEDPGLEFYREPSAPDLQLQAGELPIDDILAADVLWVTGTGLSAEPSFTATIAAMVARGQRGSPAETVLDLDWRPALWRDPSVAHARFDRALRSATVVVGNREEVGVALGIEPPQDVAGVDRASELLLARGVRLAIIKLGADGVMLADSSGERVVVRPIAVDVVCGLGAGDAFGGALSDGLIAGDSLQQIGMRANAAGACVAAQLACADAMPTRAELDAFIAEHLTETGAPRP